MSWLKQKFPQQLKNVLVFILVLSWIFSGWPRIWQWPPFPPAVPEARAETATKTWTFNSDTESWAFTRPAGANNTTESWQSADGDPANGSLQLRISGKNKADTDRRWDISGTWESLFGIPAGSTVTEVGSGTGNSYKWRVSEYATGAAGNVGPFTFRDSGENLIGTFSAATNFSATSNWAGKTGSAISVPTAPTNLQSSGTAVIFRISNDLATGNNNNAAVTVRHDTVTLTITYTPPANSPPTGSFNSAAQKNDGSGDVDISIEVDDADDNDTKAKIAYEADNTCDAFSDLTLDEAAGAAADFNDSGGSPSVVNSDTYQVGTTADRRIITSSGSNTVTFVWNSATDQASGNTTMCLQLTVNDDTEDQTTPATQTLTIDNVDPSAPGNLTENNRQATQIALDYGSAASDTNAPSSNAYRLFYKAGTSGVTESDTEWDSTDFDAYNYGGNSNTTITGLSPDTDYVFNIWSYDNYCQTVVASCTQNKNSATEITLKTRTGNFDVHASSSRSFDSSLVVLFTSQTSTMTNIGALQIVDDRGSSAGWTVNLTANDWKAGEDLKQLDYAGSGSDDNRGKMCAFPAAGTLYAEIGSLTGVSKGGNDCFSSGVSQIEVAQASSSNGTGTYWLTDMSLSQFIPANPTAAVYTTTIIFTIQ